MAPKKENGDTERNGTILWWKPMKMAIKNEKDDINGNKKKKMVRSRPQMMCNHVSRRYDFLSCLSQCLCG